jgi:hypothetical protein
LHLETNDISIFIMQNMMYILATVSKTRKWKLSDIKFALFVANHTRFSVLETKYGLSCIYLDDIQHGCYNDNILLSQGRVNVIIFMRKVLVAVKRRSCSSWYFPQNVSDEHDTLKRKSSDLAELYP